MRIAAIVVIAVALVIGGLTFYLGRNYLRSLTPQQTVATAEPVAAVEVVVAAKSLPAGTVIGDGDVRWQPWPDDLLDDAYIVQREGDGADQIDKLVGTVVRRGISIGEPVTYARVFRREEGGYLAGMLDPGMRAVSVRINEVTGTAGFIVPGDRVDVILTQELRQGGSPDAEIDMRRASETILRNVRVLAVDQTMNDFEDAAQVGKTVTLEVTPKQSEMISVANSMGNLSLALRSLAAGPGDSYAGPFTSDFEVSRALSGGADSGQRQAEAPAPFIAPAAVPRIIVATRDLVPGTLLRDSDLAWAVPAKGAVVEGLFTEGKATPKSLRGTLVRADIKATEPLAAAKVIIPDEPGFLAAALTPGMRAVSVDIGASPGIAALVAPGDRVDVVLTLDVDSDAAKAQKGPRRASETIIQNVRVLTLDPAETAAAIEVTPQQAAELATASGMGKISLSVRGFGAVDTSAATATDLDISATLKRAAGEVETVPMAAPPTAPRVLVAAKKLAVGTLLRETDLTWGPAPEGAVYTDYFVEGLSERSSVRGALLTAAVDPGAALAVDGLIRPGESGFLAAVLGPGMRAVNINATGATGLTTLISPGDRVDIVLTHRVPVSAPDGTTIERRASETIIENIRVITLDDKTGAAAIEVTPENAAKLATAVSMGEISLSVRSAEGGGAAGAVATDVEVSPALGASIAAMRPPPAPPPAATGKSTSTRVLAADRDLPEGSLLRDSDLRWTTVAEGTPTDNYFLEGRDKRERLRGALITKSFKSGALLPAMVVITPDEPGFLAAAVRPGMRAVGIGLDEVSGITGLISPGDRVDIVLTSDTKERRFSETILQKVRVLSFKEKSNTATVEVSPKQTEMLAVARTMGELSLALRSQFGEDAGNQAETNFTRDLDVSQALKRQAEAAALAARAAAALNQGTTKPTTTAPAQTAAPRVLVAKRTLAAGTLLRDRDFRFAPLPTGKPIEADDLFVEGTVNISTLLRGALVTDMIAAGAPLVASKLIKPGDHGFLAAALRPGKRAVSVGIDAVAGISGLVSPGDYVDVLMTTEIQDDTAPSTLKTRRFSETIAQGIRVLAVEQTIDTTTGKPVVGQTATLEVAPREAEVLALAARMGTVTLSLRGKEPGIPAGIGVTYTSDLGISIAEADLVSGNFDRRSDEPTSRFGAGPGERRASLSGTQRVLVAARALESGQLLGGDDLRWRPLAKGEATNGAYLEGRDRRGDLAGALVRASLDKGAIVTGDAVMLPSDPGYVSAALGPDMRAVSIGADAVADIASMVVPGDRVDVVLTYDVTKTDASGASKDQTISETILKGLRVLALDRERGTATVEVSTRQASTLAMATTMGRMTLALRGGSDTMVAEAPTKSNAEMAQSMPMMPTAIPVNVTLGTTRVLVANRDLDRGALLRNTDYQWATMPAGTPTDRFFVQGIVVRAALSGALLRGAIKAGEPLTDEALMLAGEQGYIAAALRPGRRAVSVAIDAVSGVSGFISPGDSVDVLMTQAIKDNANQPLLDPRRFSETIVRAIRVLAIEQAVDPASGKPVVGDTVTVEVTPKQAETLALGASIGSLSLSLHGVAPGEDDGQKTPFTADLEISQAAVADILRTEDIYRLRYPRIPASPPFDLRYPRAPALPIRRTTSAAPKVVTPSSTKTTTAPAPTATAKPASETVKVYRSANPTTLEFTQ